MDTYMRIFGIDLNTKDANDIDFDDKKLYHPFEKDGFKLSYEFEYDGEFVPILHNKKTNEIRYVINGKSKTKSSYDLSWQCELAKDVLTAHHRTPTTSEIVLYPGITDMTYKSEEEMLEANKNHDETAMKEYAKLENAYNADMKKYLKNNLFLYGGDILGFIRLYVKYLIKYYTAGNNIYQSKEDASKILVSLNKTIHAIDNYDHLAGIYSKDELDDLKNKNNDSSNNDSDNSELSSDDQDDDSDANSSVNFFQQLYIKIVFKHYCKKVKRAKRKAFRIIADECDKWWD